MIEIQLTQGMSSVVDDDMAHLKAWKWYASRDNKNGVFYARKDILANNSKTRTRHVSMHHCITGYPLNGFVIDHLNGNGLDNRRNNLRIVSRQENLLNTKRRREGKTSSKYIGVTLNDGRWQAQIKINGKYKYLGMFSTEEDASNKYQEIRRKYDE